MTTLRQVKALAKSMGATVCDEIIGHTHSCMVDAPDGKVWCCGFLHALTDCAYTPWKPDYADMLERMKHGLEDETGED